MAIRPDQENLILLHNSSNLVIREDGTVLNSSTKGTTGTFTQNSGTTINTSSTFTGGTGSSAYTVNDCVLALKTLGALAM